MIRWLLLCCYLTAAATAVETTPLEVVRVVDGNTLVVMSDLGDVPHEVTVRILWIDAPETRGKNAMPEGEIAASNLRMMVMGSSDHVILTTPGDEFERDRYGRVLATVTIGVGDLRDESVDRFDAGSSLLWLGAAVYWRRYGDAEGPAIGGGSRHDEMVRVQETAIENNTGIWFTAPEWAEARAAERPDE